MKKQFGSVCEFRYVELTTDEQKKLYNDILAVFFNEFHPEDENIQLLIQLNNIPK